ncbi:type ISP restriction/modification enzyme [Streptosporangium sandarakinum]|uniref:type ISP restriction/modification enzyme n=1 Tax=Streptosporangium sandarakinum TaxID=1260955 RepID=UPI0037A5CC02
MASTTPPNPLLDKAVEAVARFGKSAAVKLNGGGQPEDQLRSPLERLFADMAEGLGIPLVMIGEMSLATLGVRPDYAVDVAGARVGYVEIKAPGRGVPTTWTTPHPHEKKQWEKLRLLPNVLYTDGGLWALYRDGELVGQVARMNGDVRTASAKLTPSDGEFARIISDFLLWKPDPPRTIGQLVHAVAGLCKLLRTEVIETMGREERGEERKKVFTALYSDWHDLLFPGLTPTEFADSYAQTVTFALLLARVEGVSFEGRSLDQIAAQLGKNHSLMGKALAVLTHDAVEGRSIVVETLKRVIGAVDWDKISKNSADSYLYLYEHFLEAYDADLRKESGSYYTPNEVVSFMVRFVDDILRTKFGRTGGFADDNVTVVDPAMGTGTYLLNIVSSVARTVEEDEGAEALPGQLKKLFRRLVGFERQAGPYAVAELRMNQALKTEHGAQITERDHKLYVADTLASPFEDTQLSLSMYEPIIRSRREANRVKRESPVQVVIGNPPYRERARGMGGWIEQGADNSGHDIPIKAFKAAGFGRYEYVLSNLYVYFWRWATWKVFDAHPDQPAGVVAFITTSGYTTGPGFAGMREYLRRTADEGWIIDLSPEGHQPDVPTRVFPGVQQPLCIGVFVRYGAGDRNTPAAVHHVSLSGRRATKFAALERLRLDGPEWRTCATDWQDRLQPPGGNDWLSYPALGDLMPWQAPGVKPNRTWVYDPSPEVLRSRWDRLIKAPADSKAVLFKESAGRKIDTVLTQQVTGFAECSGAIKDEKRPCPEPIRVGYRSFDRQWVIPDARVHHRPSPALWSVASELQVFTVEQHAQPLGAGPGLVFSAFVPDMDHFKGSAGGRVLPLYRDRAAGAANLASGLTRTLDQRLDLPVSAADVLAYIAAVTAHGGYTARFAEELRTPGVRVPLTADAGLWTRAVRLGRRVLWLHTYGERFADPTEGRPTAPPRPPTGWAKVQKAIPGDPDAMPDEIGYDPDTLTLHVGAGQISPVRPEVWAYEVSGMKIVKKWFGYRKKNPTGRKSSPLDDIHTEEWPAEFTTDLLRLLHVLTLCVELEPEQAELLEQICAGPLVTVADLEQGNVFPVPAAARKPPTVAPSDVPTLL